MQSSYVDGFDKGYLAVKGHSRRDCSWAGERRRQRVRDRAALKL